jgi:LysR family transcriptional regulator, regulator for genes of the gallate degradation pathway
MSANDIDPRYLANLLSIAKHGSFNRAATARGISQPALSNSIAQLERRLGVQVLDRTRRGSELNEFGKILVRNAAVIDAVLQHTVEEVRLKRLGVEGPLRIGVTPSLAIKFVPQVLAALLKQHQNLAITVVEGLDDQLLPALLTGNIDLVLGPLAGIFPAPPEIAEEVLFEDPFSIGVGAHHPLRGRRSLTLTELREAPWILPLAGSSYRRHIEALFMTEGVPWPDNCLLSSSLSVVEYVLAHTDRVAMITELQSTMQNTWGIRSIPLKGGGQRTIGFKWRRSATLSALATRFVECAHQIVRAGALPPKPPRRADKPQRRALPSGNKSTL